MKEYRGDCPKNARIRIDYSKKNKPRVSFSYPDKKNQHAASMFIFIFMCWIILFFIFYLFPQVIIVSFEQRNNESINFSNYTLCSEWYDEHQIERCELHQNKSGFALLWDDIKQSKDFKKNSFFIFPFLFLPPFLIYFLFKKKWDNLSPQFYAALSMKKYSKFFPRDIKKDKKGNYYCKLPLFENILLDYKATKDFSRFLKFFEIEEHKFYWYTLKRKKRINDFLWYAKFYFSNKPKNGMLKVVYK